MVYTFRIMKNIPFIKMHGLGNDFVIVDCRTEKYSFTPELVQFIANRHEGVGCDQFVTIEKSEVADCFVRFYNADGSESGACGNATRCVAWIIIEESGANNAALETVSGVLNCKRAGDKLVSVDMGKAKIKWQDIPLSSELDTLHLPLEDGDLKDGVAVSMGNPHAVFFVNDVDAVDLQNSGSRLEVNDLFPERANISAAQVTGKNSIKLRVWERGTGLTQACGTGACATAVAAFRCNLTASDVTVSQPGGDLHIKIGEDLNVTMTGPVAISFEGTIK